MAIRGVNPSYFAGMPSVALDPNAHKENPQYAHMLTQAMQNRAAQAARRRENDEENVFKARNLDQQAQRDRNANDISKRNTAVGEAGEKRLQSGQDFNQDRLKSADTRDLLNALRRAQDDEDYTAVGVFSKALRERGYKVDEEQEPDKGPQAPPPAAPPPAAPPVDRSPMPPRSPPPTASFPPVGEAEAAPPMRAAPAGVAPRATASFPPVGAGAAPPPPPGPAPAPRQAPPAAAAPARGAGPPMPGWPAAPPPTDDSAFFQAPFNQAGLEAGLDKVMPTDQQILNAYIAESLRREKAGLPAAPTPKTLLPGKSLRRRASESDQLLSPDDPLLNPRAQ
jgi:hypothetical protein